MSFNKDSLVFGNSFDYVTRTSQNQGVLQQTGFVNQENINASGTWSLGLLQMDFFYRVKPWYAGQFMRKITPKIVIPEKSILFFTTILNQQKSKLHTVLVRDIDKLFEKIIVKLPINVDKKIDFEFMESFILLIEAEKISELNSYLKTARLINCALTEKEEEVLSRYNKIFWSEFKLEELFDKIKTKKLPYKADELYQEPQGEYTLPCLTASFNNQGLNYFAPKDNATILNNVISLPSNSDVYRAYYQPHDFTVLSDAYAICWKNTDINLSSEQYLFIVACINKVTNLSIYSHKNKLGGWNVVKNKLIQLPVKNGQIDYKIMETLISIIQKQTIKDVVLYNNDKVCS